MSFHKVLSDFLLLVRVSVNLTKNACDAVLITPIIAVENEVDALNDLLPYLARLGTSLTPLGGGVE